MVDDQVADLAPDLSPVDIESGDDSEGLVIDAQIASQSASKATHSDHCQIVSPVEPEESIETLGEIVDPVACSADAEFAKLCEILPYQRC